MRILFCSAEVEPFAKVGGLADVAHGLPKALSRMGHDVRVIMPGHATADDGVARAQSSFSLVVPCPIGGTTNVTYSVLERKHDATMVFVRDGGATFPRGGVYGEPDDILRYQLYCRAIAEMLIQREDWLPDIVHLNDWHTAPLAYGMRNAAWHHAHLRRTATVLTIHNLRYRGPDDYTDQLGSGIYYSDAVTAVSPRYAQEILTWEYGEGLQDLLMSRRQVLTGILNGLDMEEFDPATDSRILRPFESSTIGLRDPNRIALRNELQVGDPRRPLAGIVARLTEQKGIDLVIDAIPGMIERGVDLAVLGSGDTALEEGLRAAERAYPGRVRLAPRFDEGLARRMYAGCDMLLMPSRFEPCGLGQMIAMRYGCVPIGRRTGGLADTILDPIEFGSNATGFLFDNYAVGDFLGAIETAGRAYAQPDWWRLLQRNGMTRDFSWSASAPEYEYVYREALRRRGVEPSA